MLGSNKILGFIPTKDADRAKTFYMDILGLKFSHEDQFALELLAGGTRIRIAKVEKFEPMPFTILGWEVKEIDQLAIGLKERGVKFENYPALKQNPLGVWDSPSGARIAWFKDPDGNLLSISQHS